MAVGLLLLAILVSFTAVQAGSPAMVSLEDCIVHRAGPSVFVYQNDTVDSDYSNHRVGANARIDDRMPTVILTVTTSVQLQAAVYCAALNGSRVLPMNGGHSFEGLSTTNALLLNLDEYRNMTSISTDDPATAQVTVQSGVRLGRLYGLLVNALYPTDGTTPPAYNYVLAGGTCPGVGVTGHTLCGGYGMFGRQIGLTSDQILSYEVVTARGELVTVTDSNEHAEVFWALRGSCSSSFGLVSTTTFRLHHHTTGPSITVFNPYTVNGTSQTQISGRSNVTQAVLWFQHYATRLASPLMTMNINFKKGDLLVLEGVFLGSKKLAESLLLDDMTDGLTGIFTRQEISDMFVEGSYLDAILWWSQGGLKTVDDLLGVVALKPLSDRNSRRKAKSSLIHRVVNETGIAYIADLYNNGTINQMEWKAYGGVDTITAEPYTTAQSPLLRGHLLEAHYSSSWSTESTDPEVKAEGDAALLDKMNAAQAGLEEHCGFTKHSYVGYIDLNSTSQADQLGEVYFGVESAARLRLLREAVDPRGVLTSETSEYLYPSLTDRNKEL